ncbi:MAG: MBL fold metallo-hydrolase, partial [Anaerolineae bacterium]|nr:MBL fold metallo-hydrolase [Anaerolineae bacterium]
IKCCHLGDLNQVPTQSQVEDMGDIDVLFVPVGGQKALNATQAAEVISLIEPYVVIPMHYHLPNITIKFDSVDKFLKEMGVSSSETTDTLKLTKSSIPDETQVIVLEAKQ